jgi:simple sugar transport system permease protein
MSSPASAFFEATVRTATPLALAALGEMVVERAGIINISLEGVILSGALGALVGATTFGVGGGFVTGVAAGVAMAVVFAAFVIRLRADQIITGTAIMLLAVGLTGTLYRALYGASGAALSIPTLGPTPIPGLVNIPLIGRALFDQPAVTYVAYVLFPLTWWWMYRTHAGLALRAVGESPVAAEAAGIRASRVRFAALIFGGITGGAAGATLVIAQAGTFAEGMSAGRGFIADRDRRAWSVASAWCCDRGVGVRRGKRAAVPSAIAGAGPAIPAAFWRCLTASRSPRSPELQEKFARRRRWAASTTRNENQQRRRGLFHRARQRPSSPRSMIA